MLRFFLLFLISPVLWGCSGAVGTGGVVWNAPGPELVWPEPPDVPRIKYLRTVSPETLSDGEDARQAQWLGWLTGEDEQHLPLLAAYGVVADGLGRVWVADTQGKSLVVFDLSHKKMQRHSVFSGNALESPVGLAYDSARKRIYISDSRLAQVFVCNLSGKLVSILDHEKLIRPAGMTTDNQGNLYVADVELGMILKFSPDFIFIEQIGSRLTPNGKFNRPANLTIGGDGALYVVDSLNFRVEVISSSGVSLGSIGRIGDVPGSFARPRGVAVDSDGHIYVADAAFGNIQVFNREGQLLLFFGQSGKNVGEFSLPAGMFFDAADRLYVVDSYNHRLQLFQYLPQNGNL